MKPEIEVKFLSADHDSLRQKLSDAGAVCVQPMRLMKRKTFDFPDDRLRIDRNGWARIRDEGDKITMSYKQLNDRSLHGTHEVNLIIDSFESGDAFLCELGLIQKSYIETKRESWHLEDFEIELDVWPWAKPYIEIEGPDETTLRQLADRLGLDWSSSCFGSVEIVYQAEYDITEDEFNDIPVVTFDTAPPEFLVERKRKQI
ncbi:MAG TPA: class IV adenylate cyclase [Candidatus Saccharimonadales bacterium]|jgi:adenylate cyclase class 2